jgi:hypothetical protein
MSSTNQEQNQEQQEVININDNVTLGGLSLDEILPDNKPFKTCKFGESCKKYAVGQCTFKHDNTNSNESNKPSKPCKFGETCKKNAIGQCTFKHDEVKSKQLKPCKFGESCKKYAVGQCTYKHDEVKSNKPFKPCKFGEDCKKYAIGQCTFIHDTTVNKSDTSNDVATLLLSLNPEQLKRVLAMPSDERTLFLNALKQ